MENLEQMIKKQKWFKVGKWKEPVFLQEIVTRSYLNPGNKTALPFHTKSVFVAGFKQFVPASEYELVKKNISRAIEAKPDKIFKQIKKEVARAIKNLDSFWPSKISAPNIEKYCKLAKIHGWQSFRFIFLGYVLENLYPKILPQNFNLNKKSFTPQLLLATAALPKKLAPMIAENLSLLKIAAKIKEKKPVRRDLKTHARNFGWMNSLCWWDEPFSAEHYLAQAKILAKNNPKKKIDEVIKGRKNQLKFIAPIHKDLKNKYPKAWLYLEMTREMTDLREASWDAVSQAGVRLRPLFKKFAADNYLSYNQLMMLTVNEMTRLAKNKLKVNVNELNRRLSSFGLLCRTENINSPVVISGARVKRIENLLEGKKPVVSELSGLTIWPGKALGRVRVMQSADEIDKIKPGEILVCPMTDPDYMPAIYKARALVTDQGGMLCHAAIVARELRKICLVGTQQATKIFKTGDLVEVNADQGIVKRLK